MGTDLRFQGGFQGFTLEPVDLICGQGPEISVQGIPGFQLFTVDEQCVGPGQGPVVRIKIAEQGQAAKAGCLMPALAASSSWVSPRYSRHALIRLSPITFTATTSWANSISASFGSI
jgi:hypothetical protein